jgi:transposase-like protein
MLKIVEPKVRALLREWKQKLLEEALDHLVEEYYGPRWQKRRHHAPTPWICLECGPRDSFQVKRNSHYRRQLVVLEGVITLRIPQLRCRHCGKAVALAALFLTYRKRYWIDLDREITKLYISGVSYRQVKAMIKRQIESDAGLMSLWRRFQAKANCASYPGLKEKLKVLYLDEAYIKIKGAPFWSLLALGEGHSGKRAYLGAVQSPDLSETAWV